jgi:type IV pilus assembly protein PilC
MATEGRKASTGTKRAAKKPTTRRKPGTRTLKSLQEDSASAESAVKKKAKEPANKTAKMGASAREATETNATVSKHAPRTSFGATKPKARDVNNFLRQLIMLMEAGTPILKSLKTCAIRNEKAAVRTMVSDIAEHVETGNALWQGFERHPHEFDTVFVNLIKASEASGTLSDVLKRQVDYRERREMMVRKLRGAMLYPVVLLFFCGAVLLLISKYVIPEFRKTFLKLGDGSLPWETELFFSIIEGATSLTFLLGSVSAIVAVVVAYKLWVLNPLNRIRADRIKLSLPYLGKNIIKKRAVVEFTWTLSMMLRSGLSMMVTLDLVRSAITNRAFANTLNGVRDSVERGEGMEAPLRASAAIVPPVITDMLVTGEDSGQLDDIAEHLAKTYEEEVNIAVESLGDMLMPAMVVLIGGLVLVLFIAIFLPMIAALETLMNTA